MEFSDNNPNRTINLAKDGQIIEHNSNTGQERNVGGIVGDQYVVYLIPGSDGRLPVFTADFSELVYGNPAYRYEVVR